MADMSAADAVTCELSSCLRAGSRAERRGAVTSSVLRHRLLGEKLTLICCSAVILSRLCIQLQYLGSSPSESSTLVVGYI